MDPFPNLPRRGLTIVTNGDLPPRQVSLKSGRCHERKEGLEGKGSTSYIRIK